MNEMNGGMKGKQINMEEWINEEWKYNEGMNENEVKKE